MAFENNPEFMNFGDKYAKINKRVHSSGANIIEVLYGARDANGHPTYPERDANDGHGHWIALEIEGMYGSLRKRQKSGSLKWRYATWKANCRKSAERMAKICGAL